MPTVGLIQACTGTTGPHPVPRFRMSVAVLLLSWFAVTAWTKTSVTSVQEVRLPMWLVDGGRGTG